MRNENVNEPQNQQSCQTSVMCRAVDNLELLLSQPDESVDLILTLSDLEATTNKFLEITKPVNKPHNFNTNQNLI